MGGSIVTEEELQLEVTLEIVRVKWLEERIEKVSSGQTRTLDLGNFGFTTIPSNIKNIQNITRLYLSFNEFSTLPESISNFSGLTHLRIWKNKLTTLPTNIGKLFNLTCLELIDNQLTDLPESIGDLSNLNRLFLSANHFSHVSR
jgi:internalin A